MLFLTYPTKLLLRPKAAIAVAFMLVVSLSILVWFDNCCGRDLHVLLAALKRLGSDWKPLSLPVTDACYHENLLTKLTQMQNGRVHNLLPARQGLYAALMPPVELANITSEACANALLPASSSKENSIDSKCFKRVISETDIQRAYKELGQLFGSFTARGLEYFLLDGSLIGSVRHFGMVPWDDDIDFGIRNDQKAEVRSLFEELDKSPTFKFIDNEALTGHSKLGLMCSIADGQKSCLLQADFFHTQTVGRWLVRPEWPFAFPIDDIYPLTVRPYGPGLLLPSPRRPMHILQHEYQSDVIRQCHYEPHQSTGCPKSKQSMACQSIQATGRYPFVAFARLPAPPGILSGTNVTVELLLWKRKLVSFFIPYEN